MANWVKLGAAGLNLLLGASSIAFALRVRHHARRAQAAAERARAAADRAGRHG